MAVRPASAGLQAARLALAAVFLAVGALCAASGQWLVAAVMAAGAVGAVLAFRKGQWDPQAARQAAKDYAYPRAIGLVVGLVAAVCAGALGLLD